MLQVRELVERCQCPTQFPMIRVSEGKYRIGDTKVLIFVRVSVTACSMFTGNKIKLDSPVPDGSRASYTPSIRPLLNVGHRDQFLKV